MRGVVSFHPVDPAFFRSVIEPLVAGEKIDPEAFLDAARRVQIAARVCLRYKVAIDELLEQIEPPPPPSEGSMWDKVRARLERFDFKPPEPAVRAARTITPDLELTGRPFLITETSVEKVADIAGEFTAVDDEPAAEALVREQLIRLDPQLAREIEPGAISELGSDMTYRNELLQELKEIFELARAARAAESWGRVGEREPADRCLVRELAGRAVRLHSRAVPFWVGRDVDGLETMCRAAEIEPPSTLMPAWRLFARSIEAFPELQDRLGTELPEKDAVGVGAYVPPEDVPALLEFLSDHGAEIIRAATRQGVGPMCTVLLRKIRECAHFAERYQVGYLEVAGVYPVAEEPVEDTVETALH